MTVFISPSVSQINEGESLTTLVSTSDSELTWLYWATYSEEMDTDDFDDDLYTYPLIGSGYFGSDGTFTIPHFISNDLLTEGTETFFIKLFTDSDLTNQVAESISISVLDTSTSTPTYSLSPSSSTLNEGETLITTVKTSLPKGTTLYWATYSDEMDTDDFYSDNLSGSTNVNKDGTFTISHVIDNCLLYTSPSPRDGLLSRMPSSA